MDLIITCLSRPGPRAWDRQRGKFIPAIEREPGVFDTPTFSPIRFQTLKQSFGDVKKIILDKSVRVVRELQVLYESCKGGNKKWTEQLQPASIPLIPRHSLSH